MNIRMELFGIEPTMPLVLVAAFTFGSFSVYKSLGGGAPKDAGTFQVPSATVGRTDRSKVPAIPNLGSAVCPSAEASRPAIKTDLFAIEQIQVGERVLAESLTGDEDLQFGSDIIPADWRKLTLEAPKRDGTRINNRRL